MGNLVERLPSGSMTAIPNFSVPTADLSNYIITELTSYIVNESSLSIVDRSRLEDVRKELQFQMSDEVDELKSQAFGKIAGAEIIISGSIILQGSAYRMELRAVSVETAQILGFQIFDVKKEKRISALLSNKAITANKNFYSCRRGLIPRPLGRLKVLNP
jgi:curli biogenesis system outer membrane secretion channel CsgG